MKIQTGDVANCYMRDKFLSKAISKVTNSDLCHTAIFIYKDGVLNVAESQKDGFNTKTFDNWVKDYNYDYIITRPKLARTKHVLDQVDKYKGTTPYDKFSFFIRQPIRLIKIWSNKRFGTNFNTWKDNGKEDMKMYCSEVVAKIIGVPNYYEMTPKDVYEWQLNNGYKIITND